MENFKKPWIKLKKNWKKLNKILSKLRVARIKLSDNSLTTINAFLFISKLLKSAFASLVLFESIVNESTITNSLSFAL